MIKGTIINQILEVYLEPIRTSMIESFCKNSERILAVNYFCKNIPSQMFNWVLNTPLDFTTGLRLAQ